METTGVGAAATGVGMETTGVGATATGVGMETTGVGTTATGVGLTPTARCRELLAAATPAESSEGPSQEGWQARLARLTGTDPTLCLRCAGEVICAGSRSWLPWPPARRRGRPHDPPTLVVLDTSTLSEGWVECTLWRVCGIMAQTKLLTEVLDGGRSSPRKRFADGIIGSRGVSGRASGRGVSLSSESVAYQPCGENIAICST
jgi:hypothetical protein